MLTIARNKFFSTSNFFSPLIAANTAPIVKIGHFSKKAKKAYLKAEFEMSYEARSCSTEKVTIIRYPYLSYKCKFWVIFKSFLNPNTLQGRKFGLVWYRSSKITQKKLEINFNVIKRVTFLLQLFPKNKNSFHKTNEIWPFCGTSLPFLKSGHFSHFGPYWPLLVVQNFFYLEKN